MISLDIFLDQLEKTGFWDETCKSCERTFANTDPNTNPNTLCDTCKQQVQEVDQCLL